MLALGDVDLGTRTVSEVDEADPSETDDGSPGILRIFGILLVVIAGAVYIVAGRVVR